MAVMRKNMFRFQNLDIWKRSSKLSIPLFELSDRLERERKYRFAEQLRGATLSITNNIAEGSGSTSSRDFQRFLKYSRRSLFEVANILMILVIAKYLVMDEVDYYLGELNELSKMITGFSRSLAKS